MSNATNISIEVDLPKAKDRAIKLIVQLTSENTDKLNKMNIDELIQYLSYLMKCKQEQIEKLLVEHDQNKDIDEAALSMLWKLVNKGIVKAKHHTLGTIPEASFNQLKFIMATLGDMARFRVENGLGIAGSTITTPTINNKAQQSTFVNGSTFFNSKQASVAINSAANSNPSIISKKE